MKQCSETELRILLSDVSRFLKAMLEHSDTMFKGRRTAYCDKQYCQAMSLLARAGIEYDGLPRIADEDMRGNGL